MTRRSERTKAVTAKAERARVLVVDDDEHNLLAIRTVLEDVADIVTASSGEEALRHLLKHEFAVILLDVFMPGMDGYETAQLIRSREQTKRIPIVFLSAINKEAEHLMRGYSMGAVDYVFKPVDPVVLRSKVAVFVDLFTMTQEIQRKAKQEQELLDANLRANTELLRAEQELRRAEQRQAAIINSLPLVLYLEPYEQHPRRPAFVSGDLAAITGFDLGHIEAHPTIWEERLHEEDRERVLNALDERKADGRFSVEYRWRCADGSYKHLHDQAVLLRDADGHPLEFAGTLMDVTDRKVLERELVHARKMDAIGKLTGGIAHDFNNLLAAVLGGLGLIERRLPLEEEHRRILGMTRHAAEQGSELVRRLLAFARRQKLEPAAIDISRLSGTVNELLAHTLGGLVELEWRFGDDLWQVYADETQLELALMNLIINARDAMPDGGPICVTAENRPLGAGHALPPGEYVAVSVRDCGSGMPPEILDQVLEPFFTTKPAGKGTGLGLPMVYGFASQSGGTMTISSKVDEGTLVEILLPRAPAERSARPVPAETRVRTAPAGRRARILLVDDHDVVRTTTALLLREMGHEVSEANAARVALDQIERDPLGYDLILTDYAMPSASGLELMLQARRLSPGILGIIFTGYADADQIANRPPDIPVLGKPFSPAQLGTMIESSLARLSRAAA